MDPDQVKAAIDALKNNDAAAALTILEALIVTAAGGNADPAASEPPAGDPLAASAEPTPEQTALSAALVTLTGAAGPAEQTVFLTALIAENAKQADKLAVLELSSRLELVGELVKLGVEFPASAFIGEPADRKLVVRLSSEPLADLRARVAMHKSAKPAGHVPPARGASPPRIAPLGAKVVTLSSGVQVTLSVAEIEGCKKRNISHEDFAARKAAAVKRV